MKAISPYSRETLSLLMRTFVDSGGFGKVYSCSDTATVVKLGDYIGTNTHVKKVHYNEIPSSCIYTEIILPEYSTFRRSQANAPTSILEILVAEGRVGDNT